MLINVDYTYNGKNYCVEASVNEDNLTSEDILKIQKLVKVILASCKKSDLPKLSKIKINNDDAQLTFVNGDHKIITSEIIKKIGQLNPITDEFNDSESEWLEVLQTADIRMLFTMTADRFGKGSMGKHGRLEGNDTGVVINYVTSYMKLNNAKFPPTIIAEFDRLNKVDITEKGIREEIEWAIKEKKSVLLPGGWTNASGGHAMLFEVVPQEDGTVNFRIYNSGAGIDYQHPMGLKGTKEKVGPVEWKGISLEDIRNPHFHTAFINLMKAVDNQSTSLRTEWHPKHIYRGIKKLLKPKKVVPLKNVDPSQYLGPQSAGTCTFKCILAFLKSKLPQDEYKRFVCDLRLAVLDHALKSPHFFNADTLHRDINLIEKSLQSVSSSINNLYAQKKISSEYYQNSEKIIDGASATLIKLKSKLSESVADKIQITPVINFSIPLSSLNHSIYGASIASEDIKDIMISFMPFSNMHEKVKDLNWDDPKIFQENLSIFTKAQNAATQNGENQLLIHQSYEVLTKWPLEITFWKKMCETPEKAESLLQLVSQFESFYIHSLMMLKGSDPRFNQHAFFYVKVINIQKILAEIIFPKSAELFLGSYSFLNLQQTEELKYSKGKGFFHLFNSNPEKSFVNDWYKLGKVFDTRSPMMLPYLNDGKFVIEVWLARSLTQYFSDTMPELIPKIAAKYEEFPTLSKAAEDAYIFCDKDLPLWYRNIRQTLLNFNEIILNGNTPTLANDAELTHWSFKGKTSWFNTEGKAEISLSSKSQDQIDLRGSFKSANSKAFSDKESCYEDHSGYGRRNCFRPFSNSKFINWVKFARKLTPNEKWIQSLDFQKIKSSYPGWSEEEFKELTHICTSWLQPIENLEFFSKYSEKLKDPDYQIIFQLFMFQPNCISNFLNNPQFKTALESFIASTYEDYGNQNILQPCIFLLSLKRQLVPFGYYKDSEILNELRKLATMPHISMQDKDLIYSEIAANFNSKKRLDDQDIQDLLVSIGIETIVNKNPNWIDPMVEYMKRETIQIHHQQIKDYLSDSAKRNTTMNLICSLTHANAETKEWTFLEEKGKAPVVVSSDKTTRFSPLSGTLEYVGIVQKLPYEIVNDFDFKNLFPDVQEGKLLANGAYVFNDVGGQRTYVKHTLGKIQIEQKWPDKKETLVYLPPTSMINESSASQPHLRYTFLCKDLVVNYTHWKELSSTDTSKIYLKSKETNEEVYEAQKSLLSVKTIKRIKDEALLSIPSQVFDGIEDPAFVHEWHKNGQLLEIDLPRLGLTFKPDDLNKNRLKCEQMPGYYLPIEDNQETIPSLRTYKNYIILNSDKGNDKRVIMSVMDYKAPPALEVLEPLWEGTINLSDSRPKSLKYYTFEWKGVKSNLKSITKGGNLFLAHAYFLSGNYREASRLLKEFEDKFGPYAPDEIKSLTNILLISTADISPNATALRVRAGILLLKNHDKYAILSRPDDIQKNIPTFAKSYLNLLHKITIDKINKSDEIYLLSKLLDAEGYDAQMFGRLKILDLGSAFRMQFDLQKPETVSTKGVIPSLLEFPESDPAVIPTDDDLANTLIAAPQVTIMKYFFYWYGVAKSETQTPHKEWLKTALIFMKLESKARYAYLLEAVMSNPSKFPVLVVEELILFQISWGDVIKEANETSSIKYKKTKKGKVSLISDNPTIEEGNSINIPIEYKLLQREIDIHQISRDAKLYKVEKRAPNVSQLNALNAMLRGNSEKAVDPLVHNELERLQEDIESYKEKPLLSFYTTETPFDKWKIATQNFIDQFHKDTNLESQLSHLNRLESEILGIANVIPKQADERLIRKYKEIGEHFIPFSMEELIVNFALQSPKDLVKKNPVLDAEMVNLIYSKIHNYLLIKTQLQQLIRVQAALDDLKKNENPTLENDLFQSVCQQLDVQRAYNPSKQYPEFLVFEYFFDSFLRKDQVIKIQELLTGKLSRSKEDAKALNLVVEMIPGSGKSKILLPLIGLLRAKTGKLSLVIVPAPLLETVSSDTQNIMQGFSKRLHDLPFDRNSPMDIPSLTRIRNELKSIQENQDCLVMTSSNLEALMLKLIELTIKQVNRGKAELPEDFKLIREIISSLKANGHPLIDEVDSIINVLQEMCYSIGNKTAPPHFETEIIGNIYKSLQNNPEIKDFVRFECLKKTDPNAEILSDGNMENFKTLFTKVIIDSLSQFTMISSPLSQKSIRAFANSLSAEDHRHLTHYLLRDLDHLDEAQKYFDGLFPNIQDVVALAGEEISNLLPHTLQKICNKKYGLDQDLFPIPYSAAKTPNVGSQFANEHITINYAMQYYLIRGVSKEILEGALERLQKEISQERKANKSLNTNETQGWKRFKEIAGGRDLPLFNMNSAQQTQLLTHINQSPDSIITFVENCIIPFVEIYEGKINCNPLNLIALFGNVNGFTGTLWNAKSMHSKFTAVPDKGTDAKTISLLWEKSRDSVISLKQGTSKDLLSQLAKFEFDMIADAGGYLREGSMENTAKELSRLKSMPVAYYSVKGEKMITDGKNIKSLSETGLKTGEFLTLLDESRTTGADVPQKAAAVSLVTIGRDMLLRDLLQSVWRLRGLEKKQKPLFIVSDEVESLIKQSLNLKDDQKIRFDEILLYCIHNQAKRQGEDNFKSLKDEMWSSPKMLVFDVLLRDDIPWPFAQKVFQYAKEAKLWLEEGYEPPRKRYGTITRKIGSEEAIAEEKFSYEQMLEKMFKILPELEKYGYKKSELLESGHLSIEARRKFLPEKVQKQNNDKELSMQKMKEVEKKQQTELEINEQLQAPNEDFDCSIGNHYVFREEMPKNVVTKDGRFDLETPIIHLRAYMETDTDFKEVISEFGDIRMAINVLEWEKDKFQETRKLFGAGRTPLHFVEIDGDTITLLAQKDGVAFHDKPGFYNLTLGFINKEQKLSDAAWEKIVKIKFLNGESNFSPGELDVIKRMCHRLGVDKVRQFYDKVCLRGYPSKRVDYLESPLKQILLS